MNTQEIEAILPTFTVLERAVHYARVSGDDRKNGGRNLEDGQLNLCREHSVRKQYRVVAEFAEDDRGASGYEIDLPELNKIREMARNSEFDVLVVRELDRLSRNLAKQLIVEEELKRHGVRVEYVLAEYADSAEGRFQKHIRATVAEYEREKIRERMVRGRLNSIKAGNVFVAGRPPYGYHLEKKEGKTMLVIDEEEVRIVRLIYHWYVEDRLTIYRIVQRLTEMGVLTRGDKSRLVKKKAKGRGEWHNSTVWKILHNEVYTGVWRYSKKNANLTIKVPAIISPEIWQAAQAISKYNKANSPRNTKKEYLLSKRIVCGHCGYKMAGRSNRNIQYYICPHWHPDYTRECDLPGFRVDRVDPLLWNWLEKFITDKEVRDKGLADYQSERAKDSTPIKEELAVAEDLIRQHEKELSELQKELVELRRRGLQRSEAKTFSDMERVEATLDRLEATRARLVSQLEKQSLTEQQIKDIQEFTDSLAADLDEIRRDFKSRRRLVEMLDITVTCKVEDGQKVIYVHCRLGKDRLPFDSTSNTFCV